MKNNKNQIKEDDFSDCNYFEDLKASLEEVLALERGEPNQCRVHVREARESEGNDLSS